MPTFTTRDGVEIYDNANRPGGKGSQGLRDSFWLPGMLAGHKAVFDCIEAFSETDHTEDLIVKGSTLKVYPGAPHGMCSTLKDQVNNDLLAFFNS